MAKKVVLPGNRYGRLIVLGPAEKQYFVTCQCDCGTVKDVHVSTLTRHANPVISCGCLRKEIISSRNISGQRGVCFNKRTGKYVAYINAERKRFSLGYFNTFEEAVAARKEGEKKYWMPLTEKLEREGLQR